MTKLTKNDYLTPEVEVIAVAVEEGICNSGSTTPEYKEDDDVIIIGQLQSLNLFIHQTIMRKLFWSVLCVTALFASCAEADIEVRPVIGGEDFTATIAETRAELDGVAVLWNDADELTIFTKTAHNRHYKVKSLSNGNRSATFGYVGFSGNDGSAIENNYAVYPYDADATLAGEVITTKINAEQVYNAEKVDLSNALMAAKSTSSALQFVNSTALMRFDVANNMPDSYTLSSIKLVSAANKIAGEATINLSTDSKAVVTENGVNEVTLSGINTPITAEKQAFYVVLPATSFAAKDLTVTFTYAEGVEKSFALPAFDLELGSIKTIAYTINEGEDFEGSTPDSGEDFEGETPGTEAKPANNEIWYTTSDGNVIETYNSINNFGANIVSNTYADGKGVIKLDGDATRLLEAFEGDEALLTVTLPDSVTTLGGYSFSGCPNLTTINFGNGITTVESNAIYDCPSLSEFSGSIVSDDGYCLVVEGVLFYMLPIDESVTSYSIPNGVQSFNFCHVGSSPNVTEVSFPDSLTTLNGFGSFYSSFSNVKQYTGKFASVDGSCLIESGDLCYFAPQALTGLTSYSVPNGVTKISTKFLSSSTLTTVTFPDGITAVVYGLLNNCPNMQSVVGDIASEDGKCIVIGNTIFDFVDTKLTSYTIPEGVTAIGDEIFAQFSISLTTITVAESVNTIGNNAFSNANIKEIYFKSTTPATMKNALFNFFVVDENLKLYVPTEAVDAYKSAWSDYASFIAEYPTTPANNEIWYTNGSTTKSTAPTTPDAFGGATIVSNTYNSALGCWVIKFDSDVTAIQKTAFSTLSSITSITLPSSILTIDGSTFNRCSSLVEINIPEGVTAIMPNSAFYMCTSLVSVTLPSTLTRLGGSDFESCESLKTVYCKAINPPTGVDSCSFAPCSDELKIYVPTDSVDEYKAASGWSNYADRIVGYDF